MKSKNFNFKTNPQIDLIFGFDFSLIADLVFLFHPILVFVFCFDFGFIAVVFCFTRKFWQGKQGRRGGGRKEEKRKS